MSHPRLEFASQLPQPPATAAALGYRMPAEWEPLARVWLTVPHNVETWPGCFEPAQEQFARWMAAMAPYVEVRTTQQAGIDTNDSWIRDYGPIFVVRETSTSSLPPETPDPRPQTRPKALHDFRFNGWGGKYEVRDLDDVVPQHIARQLGLPLWIHDIVLEGGSIDVNGRGTVMTTEQCLLNPNRNPHLGRQQIEQAVHDALGTQHVIWLPGGIVGDDTDGHIDDIARFVAPDTVAGLRAPQGHPDAPMLEHNWQALTQARDQNGRKLTLIELPVPQPIVYNFPHDRFGAGGCRPVPASYANFLIANRAVFVPIFGQHTDDQALRVLEQALPDHRIIGLRAEHLVVGLGSFHCLSQQEPM